MTNAVILKNVTKAFGETIAVRNFNLSIPEGALYGLIGPNGAGKTTLIRMILSILFPDQGELNVLGHSSALEAKERIGYLPEERGLYKKMRVGDFLVYMARLKGMDPPDLKSQVSHWLQRMGLPGTERKRCEELSKGMQQKIQFITAVIHRPDLLILDEPFSGLDPVNQRVMRDLILEEHRRGVTILFSTHVMAHAEQLCDHIVMLHLGDKVLDQALSEIRQTNDPRHILFEPLDPSANMDQLRSIPGVREITSNGVGWEITLASDSSASSVIPLVVRAVVPAQIQIRRPSLEDVFISIVAGTEVQSEENAKLRASLRDGGEILEARR
ncbi:MAG: ATP-binding cassette domain-containing protein [Acidobacteriota bacterium]|jgi:ABC-2 type transport system ATP-binding protein